MTMGRRHARTALVLCSAATCALVAVYAFLIVVMGHVDVGADWRSVLVLAAPASVAVAGFVVAARPLLWPVGTVVGAMALVAAIVLAAPDVVGVACEKARPLVLVFDALAVAMPVVLLASSVAVRPGGPGSGGGWRVRLPLWQKDET